MDMSTRGLTASDAVRVVVVDAIEVTRETIEIHGLRGGAATLAAEIGVAALLMGAHVKGEERITLQLRTERPDASAFAEVDAVGTIRGRVQPSELPPVDTHRGVLVAIKSNAEKELYRGATELRSQSFEAALAEHLHSSQQVQGGVVIDIRTGPGGVTRAAGLLVERLASDPHRPSMEPEEFAKVFADLGPADIEDALNGTLRGEPIRVLDALPLLWSCRCGRDKVMGMLESLGPNAVREMADEDHGATVTCHFCGDVVEVSEAELRSLLPS